MNERIRKLMLESDCVSLNISNKMERFAELIVQECINIVKPTQHHEAFAQGYLGDIEGLELLDNKVKQIKQHFGVEE